MIEFTHYAHNKREDIIMCNPKRTRKKIPKLGVSAAIGAAIVLTILLIACPEEAPTDPTGPPAPTNLDVEIGSGQVELTWDAVAGATEYRIYSVGSDRNLTRVSEGITETTFTVTGLTNNTTYRYVVRAVNSTGVSGNSNEISATLMLPVPKNLSANPADAQISLSWDASNSAQGYRVYRADTPNGDLIDITSGTGITETSYIDTGLTNGTAYRYTVRAFNSRGESADSNEVTATPALSVPAAPANLSAAAGGTEVSLTWDTVGNAEEYQVFRADTDNGALTRIAGTTSITDTAYTDTGLTNGTAYRYTVRAVNAAGISPDSSEASVTTLALPAAPANLSAAASAAGSDLRVTLTWDEVTGATAYQIYRADTADGTLTRIAEDITITDAAYTDTGLTHSTAYRYTVRTVDNVGTSADSSEASATTRGLPAAPANLSATASGAADAFQVSLSWDAVTGATAYQIYRADTADGTLHPHSQGRCHH